MVALILLLIHIAQARLVFVAAVTRHGARYPIHPLPWFTGVGEQPGRNFTAGELTAAGARQQCLLGNELARRYP
jgi:hypothetical protein